jgi:hypothetical protein
VWTLASTGVVKTQVNNADLVDPGIHPVLQGRFGFHHLVGDDPNILSADDDRAPSTDTTVHQLHEKNKKSQKKQKGHSQKTPYDDVGGGPTNKDPSEESPRGPDKPKTSKEQEENEAGRGPARCERVCHAVDQTVDASHDFSLDEAALIRNGKHVPRDLRHGAQSWI